MVRCFIIITPIDNNCGNTFMSEVCLGFNGALFHYHHSYDNNYGNTFKLEVCLGFYGALFHYHHPYR